MLLLLLLAGLFVQGLQSSSFVKQTLQYIALGPLIILASVFVFSSSLRV